MKKEQMRTTKELKVDMKLAKEVKNKEWITQLNAKFEDRSELFKLIDEMTDIEDVILASDLKERIEG